MDSSLFSTVCFVPGERKPKYFLSIQPAKYRYLINRDTFYGPLSVHINRVWLYKNRALALFPSMDDHWTINKFITNKLWMIENEMIQYLKTQGAK